MPPPVWQDEHPQLFCWGGHFFLGEPANSTTKSARACPLIAFLDFYTKSNSLNLMAHPISLLVLLGFLKTFATGAFVRIFTVLA